jgi:hypothetical protein
LDINICIVSGGTQLRLPSPINHKIYAEIHHADYRLECGSYNTLKNKYYFKLNTIIRILPMYEWILWIDDDAYFTDFSIDIRQLCKSRPASVFLVIADGRVRTGGAWTRINSGVLLLRNCSDSLNFLMQCLETDTTTVREWWNSKEHGMFTNGDQDTLLYHILNSPDQRPFVIVPHLDLNSREYHYFNKMDEHFICHFPGLPDKISAIRKFGERFGVGPALVPPLLLKKQGFDVGIGEQFLVLQKQRLLERLRRRMGILV